MKYIVTTLLISSLLAGGFKSLEATDWPQWRGLKRNGISEETDLLTQWPEKGPREVWRRNVGIGASSVAIEGDRVYTLGNREDRDIVSCLNAKNGEILWTHKYPCSFRKRQFEGGTATTPTVDQDRVYTLSEKGDLFCLKAESGKVQWAKNLVEDFQGQPPYWGYAGSPLIVGDMLIVEAGSENGSIIALNKRTGELIWKSGDYKAGYSSPMLFQTRGDPQGILFNADGLVGFRLEDGEELWSYPWKTSWSINAATPIIEGDTIFISSGYGKGSALLDLSQGSPRALWESDQYANQFSSSVLWKGHLYGFHGNTGKKNNSLRCVEFATGKVQWKQSGLGVGTLILVGETLIIVSEKGELVLAEPDARQYRELARFQVLGGRSWVTPAFSNGQLYCRNNRGDLVCLNLAR